MINCGNVIKITSKETLELLDQNDNLVKPQQSMSLVRGTGDIHKSDIYDLIMSLTARQLSCQ